MSVILYLIFIFAFVTQSKRLTLLAGNIATLVIAPVTAGLALLLAATSLFFKHPGKIVTVSAVVTCYLVIALKNTLVDSTLIAGFAFVIFQASYLFNSAFVTQIEHSLFKRYTYLTFYPQMMCGPILKPVQFVADEHSVSNKTKKLDYGLALFMSGLVLKTLGANHIETWVDDKGTGIFNGLSAAVYIYMDFAGWSMMACGISYCIGIRFPRNFKFPWRHLDASGFWKRWNTTLYIWVSEQVVNLTRRYNMPKIMILLTSTLTLGLWHGLKLNFLGFALGIIIWHLVGRNFRHFLTKLAWFIVAFNCTGAFFISEIPGFNFNPDVLLDLNLVLGLCVFIIYEAGGTRILYNWIRRQPLMKAACLFVTPWLALHDLGNPGFFYMDF